MKPTEQEIMKQLVEQAVNRIYKEFKEFGVETFIEQDGISQEFVAYDHCFVFKIFENEGKIEGTEICNGEEKTYAASLEDAERLIQAVKDLIERLKTEK